MRVQFILQNSGMYDRLSIMTLSSALKRDGHQVRLLITDQLAEEEIIDKVNGYDPQIVAYSIMTGEYNYHIDLNTMLKGHFDFFSVVGGPHPTFMPDMTEKDGVDAICRGEGDIALPELVNRMERGVDFYDVNNFWFKGNGRVIRNEIGPLVTNLDELPFPDRELMYDADPVALTMGNRFFLSMRGCPFRCTYCFNDAYNDMNKGKGSLLRYRSVGNVIAEIREVKQKYCMDRIAFQDDIFPIKPNGWLEEFAERLPKEIGLPLHCNVRANFINDNVAQLLHKMGCKGVCMGVECGDNEVAKTVLGRNLSSDKIKDASTSLRKYKIKLITQNLVGLPVDNPLEVDLETLDFNISLRPDFA